MRFLEASGGNSGYTRHKGGSKESQDRHETEHSESLPAQLSYPLLLFSVRRHSGNTVQHWLVKRSLFTPLNLYICVSLSPLINPFFIIKWIICVHCWPLWCLSLRCFDSAGRLCGKQLLWSLGDPQTADIYSATTCLQYICCTRGQGLKSV